MNYNLQIIFDLLLCYYWWQQTFAIHCSSFLHTKLPLHFSNLAKEKLQTFKFKRLRYNSSNFFSIFRLNCFKTSPTKTDFELSLQTFCCFDIIHLLLIRKRTQIVALFSKQFLPFDKNKLILIKC